MNIKEQWIDQFEEKLWEHHTCDWDAGNRNPNYPYQLATAYFDWGVDGVPERTVEEAFKDYIAAHPIQPNTDQLALDCATKIMVLVYQAMPVGQLKAKIQCVIVDLLENK